MTNTPAPLSPLQRSNTALIDSKKLPPGLERAALIKRTRQLETASNMSLWLASAGLQATKKAKAPSRPIGDRDAQVAARMPPDLIDAVEAWAAKNDTSRSGAFRQLVELGLKAKQPGGYSDQQKQRAKEMAGEAIDANSDDKAHADDQARRKRRLIKGPEEFRDLRIDRKLK
jgi:hypothetical protein